MDWVFLLLLGISFIIIYKINKTVYYIYSILFPFLFFFLLHKVGYSLAYTSINAQLISQIAISIINGNFGRNCKFYIAFLSLFYIYLLGDSIIQSVPFISRFNIYKRSLVMYIWGIMLFEDIKGCKVNIAKLRSFFYLFVVFEILLGGLQYIFDPFRDFFKNVPYIIEGEVAEVADDIKTGLMIGSFRDVGVYANFLVTSFVIILLDMFSRNNYSRMQWLLLLLTEISILFAGLRSPLLITIIILLFSIHKYHNKIFKPLFFGGVAILLLSSGLFAQVDSLRNVGYEEGGLARSLTVFNSFSEDALTTQTTFAMTACMIPHILANPLLGIGLHQKGGYLLDIWNATLEDFSITDATLAFEIAEIGIIGVFIYTLPLLRFIRTVKASPYLYYNYKLLFFTLFLMTIVDSGFMEFNQLFLFFYAIAIWYTNKSNSFLSVKTEKRNE